jgi:outer membrane lipoprotein SlyB
MLLPLMALALVTGCSSGPNARTGTVIGGLGGAAVGGIIGNQSGHAAEGALIGAGVGAVSGNVIGGAEDERRYYRRY